MMKDTRWFLTYGLLITAVSVCIAYFWIDIPLVNFAHAQDLRQYKGLHAAQHLPKIFPYIAFVILIIVGIRSCWTRITYFEKAIFFTAVSYVIVNFLTNYFKMIFARTWPATWIDNNPSWISDNIYGFFWFIDSPAYRSFPSGHTAAIFAVVIVLCGFYRQLRWVGALACALVIVGLLGNYYHFLSDVIAGAYLGTSTGLIVLAKRNVRMEDSLEEVGI